MKPTKTTKEPQIGKRCVLSLFALMFTCNIASAETITVSGKVTSSLYGNLPIAGATVVVEGTNIMTLTNNKGDFTLDGVPIKGNLVFGFDELKPTKKKIKPGKNYNVSLEVYSYYDGDELVNIGYKSEKKSNVTGAITTLSREDMTQGSTSDFNSTLQGKVAGVTVANSVSNPGDTYSVAIRGLNSILAGNSPLYVVDGVVYDSDPGINPNEVYAVDVLKDAASTAVYGTRGAGGVILITTIGAQAAKEAQDEADNAAKEQKKAEKAAKKAAKKN
ncbi:MAG: TonB-dependent receptor plug domain-containing protein [Rikenellaceae bacterium]